jgi:hypothetical protein
MTAINESAEDNEQIQYQAILEQNLAKKLIFEERLGIIENLPSNALADETKEIYLKYMELNKLSEDGDYEENSTLVDCSIKVQVRSGGIMCYYFDGQFATSYEMKVENTTIIDTPVDYMKYSLLTHSSSIISDSSTTQVKSI